LNDSRPTPRSNAPTLTERLKSALGLLTGAQPATASGQIEPKLKSTVVETIWSQGWCAKNPALAANAISTLQERVGILEDYIKAKEIKPRKNRKHRVSTHPKGVYLSSVPPNTYLKVLRTGEIYQTSDQSWRLIYNYATGMPARMSGITRVLILHSKPD